MIRLPRLQNGGMVDPASFNRFIDILEKQLCSLEIQNGVGYNVTRGPGGPSLSINQVSGYNNTSQPFDIRLSAPSGGNSNAAVAIINPGTVAGLLPYGILNPITVNLASQVNLAINVSATSGSVTSASVAVCGGFTGQTPTAYTPAGSFQIPLGVIIEGKPWNLLAKNWVNPVPVVAYTTYEGNTNTPVPHYIWNW